MKQPKASFVIPAYNAETYLAETLDSCLMQSVKNIEVIVVDDGSTDGTAELISYFASKDKRVKVVTLLENKGRSNARNVGVASATSDVILTLDSDDIALPQRTAVTLQFMKKNPGVDIVYGQFVRIDALGNNLDGYDVKPFDIESVKKTGYTHICHSTMAVKKKVFDKVKYSDGEYSKLGIDDWTFQVQAYQNGFQFGAIKKPLTMYRYIEKKRDEQRVSELKAICLQEN